jgi:iron complex outermembrane receptor protein
MRIKKTILTLASSVIFCMIAVAEEVVKDSLGTHASSVKNVESLLQGQVAGVRVWSMDASPVSAPGVSIRGVNSLRGNGSPVYVVDGTVLNSSNTRNINPLWQHGDAAFASPLSALSFITPDDIESIQVIKNASAAALYGSKGANGVVIINTRRLEQEQMKFVWDSDVDVSVPVLKGFSTPGVSHNHRLTLGSMKDRTGYTLSAYFRDDNYLLPNTGRMMGGLRTNFETKANSAVWFGLNSHLAVGQTSQAAATAWYGNESLTVNMRKEGADVQGWVDDYDDNALDFRAVNSMWLRLNLFKGFSLKFDLGTDYEYQTRSMWWGNGTALGLANNGVAAILRTSTFAYNASGVMDYKVYIGGEHMLKVSAGAQALGNWDVFNTLNGTDFYNHSLRAKGLNIAASRALLHKYDKKYFTLGMFGNITYDWNGKVGADIAYRTDFNPEYGTWDMYPSASAYFDLANTFLQDNDVLSTLRLEGGYGETGREDYVPYDFLGSYTAGPYEKVDKSVAVFYDGRSYLHTKEWNVYLSLGFFDDRFTLEGGYYERSTADRLSVYCLGEIPEDNKWWHFTQRRELSSQESVIANTGVELTLRAVPVRTKDWNWSININGAYNFNRVASLAVEDEGGMSIGREVVATRNIQNYPVSSIVDYKGNVLGNPTPKYHGALGTILRWKDISLDILADGAADFDILNLNRMTVDNRLSIKEKYVEKGDFLRLARLSLAYDIPMKNVRGIDSFQVRLSACNLAVLTSYSGWTPDVNSFAVSNYRLGIDSGSYQAARTFVLGLNIKF